MILEPHRVGAVVLSAGASRRMGEPKLLLDLLGKPLVAYPVDAAVDAGFADVVVVAGNHAEAISLALESRRCRVAAHSEWEKGMGSSLACGIAALREAQELAAVVVLLGDQPQVAPPLLLDLVAALPEDGIATADYGDGILGPPAVFARAKFGVLAKLTGDRGARELIDQERAHVAKVPFREGLDDIDTPEDLARARRDPQQTRRES